MDQISANHWSALSDKAIAEHIGRYVREKRLEQNISQQKLAHDAAISRSTLSLLEKGDPVNLSSLLQVLRVLDQLQVLNAFNLQPSFSPIQLAKLEAEKRKRAKGKSLPPSSKVNW